MRNRKLNTLDFRFALLLPVLTLAGEPVVHHIAARQRLELLDQQREQNSKETHAPR